MQLIDFIIFIVFTLGVVVFGCSFFKKGSSADEFTSAGHSIPGWVVGMSIFATYVSSISYIGYPGKAFASNWNAFVFSLSIPIASYFAAKYFVPFYRHSGSVSAYTFLEERFGAWARIYASACYLLTQIARMGSILYLLAVPMYILMGWNLHVVIICTSIGIIIYSMMGGLKAVIWADAIQGIILIGGALLCLGILMFSMPEGPMQTFDMAIHSPEGNKFSLGAFTSDLTTSTFWVCLIYGIFINLQNYGIDQNYVQRYHAAKTDKDAKFSALFGGYLFIPVSALFFLIGSALYSYYTAGVAPLPEEIAQKPDYVFPYFIVNGLPIGLRGLLIASIFAAGMSTVSTSVTSAATIFLTDYWRPFFRKIGRSPENHRRLELTVVRLSSVVVGLLGAIVAIAMLSVESIIDAWWTLSSIFSGGMLGLFLLGCIPQKINRPAALTGCLCGIFVIGWISLADMWNLPGIHLHPYLAIVLGTCIIFLVGFFATILLKKTKN
ncbi:MAG: sodium:solute symporter [Prevotella sp.]|nr:sodium:solute symporter [Prevotella sp.]